MFAIASENSCKHCGLPSPAGNSFCCQGCEQVHTLLTEKGLSHFYELREQYNFSKPVAVKTENTEFWDEEGLPVNGTARFFIEGIHCLGCLWLLEKLPEIDPRIASAHLDMRHQILTIKLQNGVEAKWKEFTKLIASLGYSARPLDRDNAQDLRKNDFRKQLSRIGVAAFSAGNIMLLSVSVYAGADFYWSSRFGWISFALALPTLTYSAWPLYKTAFLPLLKKKISVDLGIALAVISGAGLSCWSLIKGQIGRAHV